MKKKPDLLVNGTVVRVLNVDGADFLCISDIAMIKNPVESKDVVTNWMRTTLAEDLEYIDEQSELREQIETLSMRITAFMAHLRKSKLPSFQASKLPNIQASK